MNSLKHGLFASEVVLSGEDRESFESLARKYAADFGAETEEELALVQDIVDARWRVRRVFGQESALFTLTAEQQRAHVETMFEADSETITQLARAAGFQANARLFNQLWTAEARLCRRAEQARRALVQLVDARRIETPDPVEVAELSLAPEPKTQTAASGFVPQPSADSVFPPHMPRFAGPLKKENRRQWLRKHGYNSLAKAA